MNVHNYLKCNVCGKIIDVKTQIGYLEQHPIRVHCGNCGILIEGTCYQNQEEVTYNFEFSNAEKVDGKPNYYIESSGELITKKIEVFDMNDEDKYHISPFFNTVDSMSFEDMRKFITSAIEFVHRVKKNWSSIRKVFELWDIGSLEYLRKELHALLPEKIYPADNRLEMLRGIHAIVMNSFMLLYDKEFFNSSAKTIMKEVTGFDALKRKDLVDFFTKSDMLASYQRRITKALDSFVEIYEFLIPAYGICFYEDQDIDFDLFGTTTCSFEDVKQFYLDTYETILELILLPIGLNNLKYRGDFNILKHTTKKVVTLENLFSESKGTRIQHIDQSELFIQVLSLDINNKLRNAIGHNNYQYNGITQKITYIPDTRKPDRKESIYLLEFCLQCIRLIKSLIGLEELVYQLRKLEFIYQGDTLTIDVKEFFKDVGRNEPCPCGSGLKYKKCHGK